MEFVIVTPSYNQKKFLKQTLQSIVDQKNVIVHHWVFDGGSDDGSKQLLQNHKKNIYFESKKDNGQSDAINKGIRKLKNWIKKENKNPNEIIFAYLNSDDYYLPNALSTLQKTFQENKNTKWVVGDCMIVNEENKEIQKPIRIYKQFWRFFLSKRVLGVLNPVPQPGVFIKASEILKIGFFNEGLNYVMDYEYWFRIINKIGAPEIISDTVAAFRIHKQSKGTGGFEDQFEEQLKIAKKFIKNPLILKLHKLHNALIVNCYRIVK
ncbi:MAG: glycosyltransferase [Candidatus Pacebacteria bacterium]|jgi:glycosyltransferase involved in cell wall biosynthesis|nr:glycosyltransferase [Candidatus Paceibacterota bacterium]MBT6756048.1 glycosyltransferase [Candidatus Paceibacterota bacterium]